VSFSPKRHRWSIKVQDRYAIPIYKRIWPGALIEPIAKYAIGNDRWGRRDFSGLDIIIALPQGTEIHLAQRFRSSDSGDDFSLRYKVPKLGGGLQESEYFKFLTAYKEGHWYPTHYAFGNTKFSLKEDPLKVNYEQGFSNFYVFKMGTLLRLISEGGLKYSGPYANPTPDGKLNGSSGVYFRLDDIPEEAVYFKLER